MQVQRPGIGPGHQATLQRLQLTAAAFQNPFGAANQYMPVRVADVDTMLCTSYNDVAYVVCNDAAAVVPEPRWSLA